MGSLALHRWYWSHGEPRLLLSSSGLCINPDGRAAQLDRFELLTQPLFEHWLRLGQVGSVRSAGTTPEVRERRVMEIWDQLLGCEWRAEQPRLSWWRRMRTWLTEGWNE